MRRGTKRWILWVGKLFTLIIYAILLAYSVIVGIAFVLQLLGANPTADFADWIYRAAANITEPFRGIFPTTQVTDRSTFNASLLFALMIYLIVAVLLHGVIDWLTRRIAGIDRAEEQDRQMAALEAQREADAHRARRDGAGGGPTRRCPAGRRSGGLGSDLGVSRAVTSCRRPSRATRSTRPTPEPIAGPRPTAARGRSSRRRGASGVRRCRGRALELEQQLVRVAPVPVLARLVGADDGMAAGPLVRRGVAPRRAVTAAHVTTGLAHPQVHPVVVARGEAVLAARRGRRDVQDLVEVAAGVHHGVLVYWR